MFLKTNNPIGYPWLLIIGYNTSLIFCPTQDQLNKYSLANWQDNPNYFLIK